MSKCLYKYLGIIIFGFILLNITFIMAFLFQTIFRGILDLFLEYNDYTWLPFITHGLFMVLIIYLSWLIFKAKLSTYYKAIYMVVPTAVIFITVSILCYPIVWLGYLINSILGISVLIYFYKTKQPWLYYYAVILMGLVLLIFTLLGGKI